MEETIAKQLTGPPLCSEAIEDAPQKYRSYWENMQYTLGYKNILGLGGATLSTASERWTVTPEPESSGERNECIDYKDWIPASAESTPRIRKKYSGGDDGARVIYQLTPKIDQSLTGVYQSSH